MNHKFDIFKKHINVSCETLDKLVIYFELLCFWQKKMNLVSRKIYYQTTKKVQKRELYGFGW